MQLVAILTWKHLVRAECQLHLMQTQRLQKKDFLTGKMHWRKRRDFKSVSRLTGIIMEAVARYVTPPATVIGDIGGLQSERHAESTSSRKSKDH